MTAVDASDRGLVWKLYHGETAFDFVGRYKRWFALSGLVIVIGVVGLVGRGGLNFGIDFKGGTQWEVPANGATISAARSAVAKAGVNNAVVQTLKGANGTDLRVQAKVPPTSRGPVQTALANLTHQDVNAVTVNSVGPTWGHEITHKAEVALLAFFIAVGIFITFRFQAKMAIAAIVAVIHDVLVTVGIYAVFGFDVTPNTVIAVLTILGYSLYDTVVVFDKVDENTKGLAASGRMTYSDTVNLSMNQVLMRSINTSLVAVLPVLSVLVIGDAFLGATTLKEFGLALFVGLVSGAYSSIFIAAPILALLKEREPRYATIRQRLEARGGAGALLTPRAAAEANAAPTRTRGSGAARATARAATATIEDDYYDEGDVEQDAGPPLLRPSGAGLGSGGQPARRGPAGSGAPGSGARPRPTGQRPPPRGRKKGKRR